LEGSGESACCGGSALGHFACEQGAGSKEADGGGDASGDERQIGAVAGMANALLGDFVFDAGLGDWARRWVEIFHGVSWGDSGLEGARSLFTMKR
jgi:hypothetical protein